MAAPAISIRNLDHLGLVAALCQELGIARMIDALLPKTPPFKVSHGEALVAMIVMHIPADHEHRFRFNVNTISGPM